MSTWLFDLGNTRLKCAPVLNAGSDLDQGIGEVSALAHDAGLPALPESARGDVALVASVAPDALRVALLDTLTARFTRIHIARTQARCGRLRIAYATPAHLGVDRFLSLLALADEVRDTLLVSVGTALTIDLLDASAQHRGGRIAPSPTLMREALAARSSALPPQGGDYAEFADDTVHALASGCEGAAIALIERSLVQAATLLGTSPRLVMHGGGAGALAPRLPGAQPRDHLVLYGLLHWGRHMGIA